MKWNLRKRIMLPALTLVATIAAAITFLSFTMSKSALTNSLEHQLDQLCAAGLQQVENWIDGQRQNLLHWAEQPDALAALQTDAADFRTRVSAELEGAKRIYGFLEDVHLADSTGATMASSNPGSVGHLNVADRQYFRDAMNGQTAVSEVLTSRTTGNPIVVISTPVKEGTLTRGVIYCVLDLNWFSSRFIDPIRVLDTGYAFLFDERGVFIAHPNKDLIMKSKLADFEWGRPLLQQRQGFIQYEFEEVSKQASFRTSDTLGWGMVLGVPISELNAPVYRLGRVSICLGLLALGVGAAVL